MTNIERSHFYLEIGDKLGELLGELANLEQQHANWLNDAKTEFEKACKFGIFTISIESVQSLKQNFLAGKLLAVLFGLRELDLLFYRRKHFFDETSIDEDHLTLILRNTLEIFNKNAETYLEEKLDSLTPTELQDFETKLRNWSILKTQGADATNEISTLLCREGASKPHSILFEMPLAKEVYQQAKYQQEQGQLNNEEKLLLEAFIADFTKANLESWEI